jgi:hypothetical protein
LKRILIPKPICCNLYWTLHNYGSFS